MSDQVVSGGDGVLRPRGIEPQALAYASDWIERNRYMRPAAGTDPRDNHFESYDRPVIVCLCGSTRFYDEYQRQNYALTMSGAIVLTVGHYPNAPGGAHGQLVGCTPEEKYACDVLHKEKIKLADAVAVLNVGGYVGDSTRSEVLQAYRKGKAVMWLEPGRVPEDLLPTAPVDPVAFATAISGAADGSEVVWVGLTRRRYRVVTGPGGSVGVLSFEEVQARWNQMKGNGPWVFAPAKQPVGAPAE